MSDSRPPAPESPPPSGSGYGRGARIFSIGIATTGLVTFTYFALAAHALTDVEYKRISLVWSIMFVVASVIYRPIEQLLSRTIADRRARGLTGGGDNLRVPLLIQGAFALTFLVIALALRDLLQNDLFDGSAALYWVLVVGVLAYAASYFARGFLAGHQRFELYGALVFFEAVSRVCFATAVVVGIASGQTAVALGMAVAPLMSLVVVPVFFARRNAAAPADPAALQDKEGGLTLRRGLGFAVAVFAIMVAEQTLLNAAVLTVEGTSDDAVLAGIVFSVLLIARAPLQLFQAVQGSLLPHLAALQATAGAQEFRRAIRITLLSIAGFALAVAIGLFALGPQVVRALFDIDRDIARGGLALVALGMGFHLVAGTLNQAALARGQALGAALAWLLSAGAFVIWMLSPSIDDQLLRTEVGYCGATAVLSALLGLVYRAGGSVGARGDPAPAPAAS